MNDKDLYTVRLIMHENIAKVHKATTQIHEYLQNIYTDIELIPHSVFQDDDVKILITINKSGINTTFTKTYPYSAFTDENMKSLIDNYIDVFDIWITNCVIFEESKE